MKVTLHISHSDADDLAAVHATAEALGFGLTERGPFMGRRHAEIAGDLSPAELRRMLEALSDPLSAAA